MDLGATGGVASARSVEPDAAAAEKRRTLDEVLGSETFARCDQLRSFLKYVGDMAIEGRAREVTEYLIAVEALGRPQGFSPADDSSVRSRAHELRRKLHKYYETEAPAASLRIELPKGSYIPRFVAAPGPPSEPPTEPPVLAPVEPARKRGGIFLVAAAALLGLFAGALLTRTAAPERGAGRSSPIVAEAWGALARPDSNVLMCVATTLHLVVRPYMTVVAEGLPKYPAPPELYPLYTQHRPLPAGVELDMHPVDNSVQMGHMGAVITLTGVLQARGASFEVLPERSAPVTAMRGRNVILIGDPQNSSAAAGFLEKAAFTIDYDAGAQDLVVRDRKHGRTFVPRRGPDKRYTDVYGLVTVLPTPGAKGDQRTVVLSGITSVGTQGAAEFFASARELEALKKRFRAAGLVGFPSAYQVVVHCKSQDTLLISEDYQAHDR
jgi:hypothetical protein